jgi:hypothetical protein
MNFMSCSRIAVTLLFSGFLASASAQSNTSNQPFSWKETTDAWYKAGKFTFRYADNLTPKGGQTIKTKISRGPACSMDCKEATAPDVCTESLVKEKLGNVDLPGFKLPKGYSGVEYVTFEVQTNGKTSGFQVVKQPVLCKPCIQKAVNLVAELGEWHPAVQDGIFVKSTVVVPVYFK